MYDYLIVGAELAGATFARCMMHCRNSKYWGYHVW